MATVRVTYDGTGLLKISDEPTTPLQEGDWIAWHFENLEPGWLPYIRFATRFGPFHSLRSFPGGYLLGKGNTGVSGDYPYTAWVLDPASSKPVASADGTIGNAASTPDTSPEARVVFDESLPEPERLKVDPPVLRLNPGDTATWVVSGIPDGAFVTFDFGTREGSSEPMRGPFTAFYLVPGDEKGSARACGIGFVTKTEPKPSRSTYSYNIRVWDEKGTHLGWHDPAIDNIGPPIPPPDGDGEG
jgi:hypothetical protein